MKKRKEIEKEERKRVREEKRNEKKIQDELKRKNKETKRKTEIRASTRQKKKKVMEDVGEACGVCGREWEELTDEHEIWLDCGLCGDWIHTDCIGYAAVSLEELEDVNYTCDLCTP